MVDVHSEGEWVLEGSDHGLDLLELVCVLGGGAESVGSGDGMESVRQVRESIGDTRDGLCLELSNCIFQVLGDNLLIGNGAGDVVSKTFSLESSNHKTLGNLSHFSGRESISRANKKSCNKWRCFHIKIVKIIIKMILLNIK